MKLVVMISSYREGSLIRGCLKSITDCEPDGVVIWEGPAGSARCDDAPETDLTDLIPWPNYFRHEGEWLSDGDKRTAMLKFAKEHWPNEPLWGLTIDGDEILRNGDQIRDIIQMLTWDDEAQGASLFDPEHPPTGGVPVLHVEPWGGVTWVRGRLLRLDLIRAYALGGLIVELINGGEFRIGNVPLNGSEWAAKRLDGDNYFMMPPLPGDPYTVHRNHLRHPARRALRMNHQELELLAQRGEDTSWVTKKR